MIAVVLEDRCIGCGTCVEVCPTDVLEAAPDGTAVIARVDDCQTCFACELYCPVDALYVDGDCETARSVDAETARRSPTLGQYRRHAGWGDEAALHPNEFWRMERMFQSLRPPSPPSPTKERP